MSTTTWNYYPGTGLLHQKLDAANNGPTYTTPPPAASKPANGPDFKLKT